MSKIKKYFVVSSLTLLVLFLGDMLYKRVVHRDVMSYADSYDVSFKVAKYRLDIQKEIGDLDSFLTNNYNGSFSGLYIQHKPAYSINVLFSDTNKANKLEYLWAEKSWSEYVRTRHVEYSFNELMLALYKVNELISQSKTFNSTYLEIRSNRVYLHVLKERYFEKMLLEKDLELPKEVTTIIVKEFLQDVDF